MRRIGLAVVLAVSLTFAPCDIRAAQVISLFGGPVPESPCTLKGLSHT